MTKKIRKILEYPFRVVETPITVDQGKVWKRKMIIFISGFLVAFLFTLLRH